jgi:response regulator of citrate/malate metabolism
MGVSDDDQTRRETGQFGSGFDDDDFVTVVERLELPTSGDVADEVGCSRSTARRRLKQLEEDREIESKAVGGYRVWLRA